jgi:hypothetical protein
MSFWFAFLLWPSMLNISSGIYWPCVFILWRMICLVHLPIYSMGCWFFRGLVFWVPCIFWLSIPCQMLAKIFSHSVGRLFILVTVSFAVQKLFSLMQSHLSILSLNCWAIRVLFMKLFPMPLCSSAFPILSYSSFTVSDLILRSLIHLELILAQRERLGSSSNLLHVDIQFSQHHLLKRLYFVQSMFWTLSKIKWL